MSLLRVYKQCWWGKSDINVFSLCFRAKYENSCETVFQASDSTFLTTLWTFCEGVFRGFRRLVPFTNTVPLEPISPQTLSEWLCFHLNHLLLQKFEWNSSLNVDILWSSLLRAQLKSALVLNRVPVNGSGVFGLSMMRLESFSVLLFLTFAVMMACGSLS